MMKFVKILLICLLLSACSKTYDINNALDDIFSNKTASSVRFNNYAKYLDYYRPTDIYEESCDDISYVFVMDDCKFIMNINIAGIIDSQYYQDYSLSDDGFFDDDKLIYSYTSYYLDADNNKIAYFFNLYAYDNQYLLHFANSLLNFYGYCDYDNIKLMASKIYDMAKSTSVDTNAILTNYSSKDVIEYHKSTVNLFETVMPVEGRVEDMMMDNDQSLSDE